MKILIEGHIKSSPDEMEAMYNTLYDYCRDSIDRMKEYKKYKIHIDKYFNR